ncbi:MAG: hypothetical protein V1856_02460 [Candidatus Liptonbacteria bacterium]
MQINILKRVDWLIAIAIAAVIVGGGLSWYWLRPLPVYDFAVNEILAYKENSIDVIMTYQSELKPELADPVNQVRAEIVIGPATKITKVVRRRPSPEELGKTGGMYRPDDLPTQTFPSTLVEMFESGVTGFSGRSDASIYPKTLFTASEINYYIID